MRIVIPVRNLILTVVTILFWIGFYFFMINVMKADPTVQFFMACGGCAYNNFTIWGGDK